MTRYIRATCFLLAAVATYFLLAALATYLLLAATVAPAHAFGPCALCNLGYVVQGFQGQQPQPNPYFTQQQQLWEMQNQTRLMEQQNRILQQQQFEQRQRQMFPSLQPVR